MAAGFATAASAADPPPPIAPPAPGVAPGAYASGANTLNHFVVYTGTDSGVWEKEVGNGPATPLGGQLISAPSPVLAGTTRIVFGQGTDHALWEKVGSGGWTSLGGFLTSKPGAAASSSSTYRVYVRGGDGAVWARNHTSVGWGPWHSVGGRVLSGTGPSAAVATGTFYVLVAGTNRGLFIAADGGAFSDAAGGVTTSSPALVNAPSSGSLVGFARGPNNPGAGYFHRFITGGDGWTSMGGRLTSGMGGSSTGGDWLAYGLGTDNQVWQHAGITGATGSWTRVTP